MQHPRLRWSRALAALAAICLAPMAASAQGLVDEPRSLGMGGAVRGDPMANNALIHNVAGMARAYTYAAEAQYLRGGGLDLNALAANIVDSKTQPTVAVGAAYAYHFVDSGAEYDVDGHDARLAFATQVVPGQIFGGVGMHYLRFDRPEVLGKKINALTLDAGAHVMLGQSFALGLTGHNLIDVDDPAYPIEAGSGLAWVGAGYTLDFDFLVDFTTQDTPMPVYRVGGELFIADSVPIRLGYSRLEASETQFISGGLGFVNASGQNSGSAFNIGYRGNLEDGQDFVLSVGLTLYL